jgi:hypothetical protein
VTGSSPRAYDPYPSYEPVGGVVLSGWTTLADHAARTRLLAVDGPEIAPWDELVSQLRRELGERGIAVHALDAREGMASWEAIVASTSSTVLADDPDFETLAVASLEDLFRRPVQADRDTDALTVIFGPGAALSRHDELWYFDQPKRYAEASVGAGTGRNLGQRDMPGNSTRPVNTVRAPGHSDATAYRGRAPWQPPRPPRRSRTLSMSTSWTPTGGMTEWRRARSRSTSFRTSSAAASSLDRGAPSHGSSGLGQERRRRRSARWRTATRMRHNARR